MKKIKLDSNNIPQHIGIIMDGNRRWAEKNGLSVNDGHKAGSQALEKIIEYCLKLGVKTLTVYALSTENWRERSQKEVKGIFDLLVSYVKERKKDYARRGVKLAVLGKFQAFPRRVVGALKEVLGVIKKEERLKVNVALNYGGRGEIIKAVKEIMAKKIPIEKVTEETFGKFLYTNGEVDPDLIIRTGGEIRLSNFLLWQMSYSELYFTDTLWPNFSPKELDKAIFEYQRRQRNFGK